MPTPTVVIFDLGKVLLDFDYTIALRRLLPRCRVSMDALRAAVTHHQLLVEYETGLLGTVAFFDQLRDAIGYEGSLDEFRAVFGDIFTPIEPMIALHAALRRQGIPTYLLSNTNEMAVEFIRPRYPWLADFDGLVLSYEHRSMKPAPALYEVVERLAGRPPGELFYLDDRPENIDTALARGWQALVHVDPVQSRAALAAAGLPVNGAAGAASGRS